MIKFLYGLFCLLAAVTGWFVACCSTVGPADTTAGGGRCSGVWWIFRFSPELTEPAAAPCRRLGRELPSGMNDKSILLQTTSRTTPTSTGGCRCRTAGSASTPPPPTPPVDRCTSVNGSEQRPATTVSHNWGRAAAKLQISSAVPAFSLCAWLKTGPNFSKIIA